MAYTSINFKSKKALKTAIKEGQEIGVWSPGPFPLHESATITLEGPHYPEQHRWQAIAVVENGLIVKVF